VRLYGSWGNTEKAVRFEALLRTRTGR
jgi:hypothetical protein